MEILSRKEIDHEKNNIDLFGNVVVYVRSLVGGRKPNGTDTKLILFRFRIWI
jgi:hypothetical protein